MLSHFLQCGGFDSFTFHLLQRHPNNITEQKFHPKLLFYCCSKKFINYLVLLTFAFLQVFQQILAQVNRICPFVRRVHVVGVLMRLQPDYYGPIDEIN